MFRKPVRSFAVLAVAALVATMLASPTGAATRSQTQGVTDDEITIVPLVADLDGLRSRGINLPAKLTTGNLAKRWQGYFDYFCEQLGGSGASRGKSRAQAGGGCEVNGRKLVVEPATWDPIDPTSFDKTCTDATQNKEPFVVTNANGYRQSSLACLTVDNKTPVFYGESVYDELVKASGNRLPTLGVSAEANAATVASMLKKAELVPKTAKIGLLTGNEPGIKAASDAVAKQLKKAGFNVASTVEVNTLQGDPNAINRESAAAVGTMKAAGVDTVFVFIPFTATTGYYQESQRSNAGFKNFIIDAASSMCTQFGASRIPAEVVGVPCITTWDTRALPTKDGIKKDNEFEAECRAAFDATFNQKSQPGVPAGDLTAGGTTYTEDFPPSECLMAKLLVDAIAKAGKKLTWDKVAKNMMSSGAGPAAYMSNGEGSFSKKKPFYADQVHLQTLQTANATTPKDANGLYNGCPAPVNCWIPQVLGGQEWYPVVMP